MTAESGDHDAGPAPSTWSSDVLDGMSEDERRAEIAALHARALDDAVRRRGRPLRPGDISSDKGRLPTVTEVVRPAAGAEEVP
ncbi:hypothetical protein [Cellulomonas endometrii]|jgi:hypothetical protein|uniref:hypothetical protein n=1 Tax=Cellulomonas endometrii TaxID=3036301 RepID=UPI0024AD3215|nr:hypothetical protein [Cellulomonas endometrii]